MESLFISKDVKISADGGTLLLTAEGRKNRVPIRGLSQIVIAGEAGLTSSLIALLGKNDVRIVVLDWYGNVTGSFEPAGNPRSGKVRQQQALLSADPERRADLARRFVTGAGRNILANLRYRKYRGARGLEKPISEISEHLKSAEAACDINVLMGHEGMMRSWYYDAWKVIDPRLDFGPRVRRPPNNEINCLISWFNGLVYTLCRNEAAKTHLDDCLSFLHAPSEARSSLALDIAEIFKPAVCDPLIFEQILRGADISSWFETSEGVCRLSPSGRKATLELWAARVDDPIGGQSSLRDLVRAEALAIERHVLGVAEYHPWRRKV